MKRTSHALALGMFATMMLTVSCDLLDCTQEDVSLLRIEVCGTDGVNTPLPDTLSITASGTESVLLNRSTNTKSILLPLSYHLAADTFVLHNYGEDYSCKDTLVVEKTNNIYFESPDCPTVMMHTIQKVSCTNAFIDSVKVNHGKVDFEEVTHLKLYIRQ